MPGGRVDRRPLSGFKFKLKQHGMKSRNRSDERGVINVVARRTAIHHPAPWPYRPDRV
jgi:hypothetical protein